MTDAPAAMLLGFTSETERAKRLLAMPDSALLSGSDELAAVCRHDRAAHDYVTARIATLNATRDGTGAPPPHLSIQLGHARMALRKVAGT